MGDHRTCCAVCGATGELHEHHLIPRVHGGQHGPTVMLCIPCHSLVHGREFSPRHRELTLAGLARARARGVKLGGPGGTFDPSVAKIGRDRQSARSAEWLAASLAHVRAAQAAGCRTQREIADHLTAAGAPLPRGRIWRISQVQRVLAFGTAERG